MNFPYLLNLSLVKFDLYIYFLLDLCSFALFVEALFLLRTLLLTRQPLRRYLFVIIPLGVSAWSFMVAIQSWQNYTVFQGIIGTHLTPAFYQHLLMVRAETLIPCLFQVQLIVAVFIGMLLWKRRSLPQVERTPSWVLAKETILFRS